MRTCCASGCVSSRPAAAGVPRQRRDEARGGRDRAAEEGERQAQDGARHPEKSRGLLRQGLTLKFEFVAKQQGAWPVNLMCEALGVSRSGFYAWLSRPRSARSLNDEVLGRHVRQRFLGSDRTYGARRVWRNMLALGQCCGLHRVERLMRAQALRARPRRRGLPQYRGERSAIADNVLDRHSKLTRRTRSGSPTSPTSGRPRDGCTWRWCLTCTRAVQWAGRCSPA